MDGKSNMRDVLRSLMAASGDTLNAASEKSGVPEPTISRFLTGLHDDLRAGNVRKLALAYCVSESQLRGDLPITGLEIPAAKPDLKHLLTRDERRLLSIYGKIDRRTRLAWLEIGSKLSTDGEKKTRQDEQPAQADIFTNPLVRSKYRGGEDAVNNEPKVRASNRKP